MRLEKLTRIHGNADLRTIASGSRETCRWVMIQDFSGSMMQQYNVDVCSPYDDKLPVITQVGSVYACCNEVGAIIKDGSGDVTQWFLKQNEPQQPAVLIDIQKDKNSYLLAYPGHSLNESIDKADAEARLSFLCKNYKDLDDMFQSLPTEEFQKVGFFCLVPVDKEEREESHLAGYRFIEDFMFTSVVKLVYP